MNTRKLDALVAEKVMGHAVKYTNDPEPWKYIYFPHKHTPIQASPIPHYTTDIKAAWEVVEKFDLFDLSKSAVGDFSASGWIANKCVHVYAGTAPMAICLAALKAVGVEVPE